LRLFLIYKKLDTITETLSGGKNMKALQRFLRTLIISCCVLSMALFVVACGGDDEKDPTDTKIPFGGEAYLTDDASGYEFPLFVDDTLIYRNDTGIQMYDMAANAASTVKDSAGAAVMKRGTVLVSGSSIAWQHSATTLKIYNRNTDLVKTIAPIPNPMMPNMCMVDEYILFMAKNKRLYMYNLLSQTGNYTMPYSTTDAKQSEHFACFGNKIAVTTDDGTLLIADWAQAGELVSVPAASRVEIAANGIPQQVVINDKYVAYVTDANEIYMVSLADTSIAVRVAARKSPAEGATQIDDLLLQGDYLVWSDDGFGYYTPFYADLSSNQGQGFVQSQMTNDSHDQKAPTINPATGIMYWSDWVNGDTEVPVLYRGEI